MIRLCRAWGKPPEWFDALPLADRRKIAAEFALSGLDAKGREKMINRVGHRKWKRAFDKARRV